MKRPSILRAIRVKCLDCSVGSPKRVRDCPLTDCPLFPYRLGKNPARRGKGGRGVPFPRRGSAGNPPSERGEIAKETILGAG